jgi:hypothetical protein
MEVAGGRRGKTNTNRSGHRGAEGAAWFRQ